MLEDSVGYQLKRAQQALRHEIDNGLREVGLTTAQYAALSALESSPGLSGADIARQSFVTPQTMNEIVSNLEQAGFIERRQHPQQGRVLQAYLTRTGEQRLRQAHRLVGAVEERLVSGLNRTEQKQLVSWLRQCCEALESQA
jgi:DNA-binding MarR family transcriptional regulator